MIFTIFLFIGLIFFIIFNVLLKGILFFNIFLFILIEILLLWVCFGLQIMLHIILKLNEKLKKYILIEEKIEYMNHTIENLELKNFEYKNKYNKNLSDYTKASNIMLEKQQDTIKALNNLKNDLKLTINDLNKENNYLKEKNKKLEKIILKNYKRIENDE